MKTKYLISNLYLYSIKIQTNIDQNAIKYLQKIIDFLKEFFEFFCFWAGPNPALCGWAGPSPFVWLGWTQPTQPGHWPKAIDPIMPCTRKNLGVHEQCEGN